MAQRRGNRKRRASESFTSAADEKKQKPPPTEDNRSTSLPDKRRPQPLKSSFRKGVGSSKRISQPVTFSKSVKYDDGSQSDISRPPIAPSPLHRDSAGSKVQVVQPRSEERRVGKECR